MQIQPNFFPLILEEPNDLLNERAAQNKKQSFYPLIFGMGFVLLFFQWPRTLLFLIMSWGPPVVLLVSVCNFDVFHSILAKCKNWQQTQEKFDVLIDAKVAAENVRSRNRLHSRETAAQFYEKNNLNPAKKVTSIESIFNRSETKIIRVNFYHNQEILFIQGVEDEEQVMQEGGRIAILKIQNNEKWAELVREFSGRNLVGLTLSKLATSD